MKECECRPGAQLLPHKKMVVFGAGNIGRSFVGQLFARAGYQVSFVDIDEVVINALNQERRYLIQVKDRQPEEIWVEGVSGIDTRDKEKAARAVAEADIAATAVGPGALPQIFPTIALGLEQRRQAGKSPLDIIICENLRGAAQVFTDGLKQHLPCDFPVTDYVGLIETSIGKMVPIMPEEARKRDPLLLYAEAYNTLILDAKGFKNPIPVVPGLNPKQNMIAYVDRKAFIHNLGHAACAYLGHLQHPDYKYLWEAVENEDVRQAARRAMWESGRSLILRYPDDFSEQNQGEHIDDLLSRFANQALGDTIFRVGRDLPRKLSRSDRLVGALLLDAEMGIPAPATTSALTAGFFFRTTDERGRPFPADAEFHRNLTEKGVDWALREVCGLNISKPVEATIADQIKQKYEYLKIA